MKAVYGLLIFLIGCAQVPKPSMYPYTLQQHMQAAHHWDALASQIVGQLMAGLRSGSVPSREWVYVEDHEYRSPFDQAFRSFLITELRKQNFPVSFNPNNPLKIGWDVQLVVHHGPRRNPRSFGLLDGLFLNLDVRQGSHGGPLPHSEVIITTTISDEGLVWLRDSTVFYINDEDQQHYVDGSRPAAPQKTYAVVGCPAEELCRDR
jgi:hypothetical protein